MTEKFTILVPLATRSDKAIAAPVVRLLAEEPWCTVRILALDPPHFESSYALTYSHVDAHPTDFALIFGDRTEMFAAACALFHQNVPFAHVYAGTANSLATHDDYQRHAITLLSSVQFCESADAARRVFNLMLAVRLPRDEHNVGITHLDNIEIDESCAPPEPYDLVLYNPVTTGSYHGLATSLAEVRDIKALLAESTRATVVISPNPDMGRDVADSLHLLAQYRFVELTHAQFLGLLRRASRFITNSSSAIYEAPVLMRPGCDIVHIGLRNRGRDKGPFETGGSAKIVAWLRGAYGPDAGD